MATHGPFEFEIGQRTQLGGVRSTVVARGCGAFGAVYVLESDEGGRVAVKTPRRDLPLNSDVFARFAEEARVWINLPWHPSVLEARRILTHQDRSYVEMDYVPPINAHGSCIAALLAGIPKEGVLNPSAVWTIAAHLIDALAHIEQDDSSFVHGDIKPANLLLKLQPENPGEGIDDVGLDHVTVQLSDFGMSRAAGTALNSKRLGDIAYLAPEILDINPVDTVIAPEEIARFNSKSADAYSVGCTIFELLFNHPRQSFNPTTGILAFALDRRLDPEQLSSLRPDLDLPYAELVASCLDPNPAQRPQTYTDLRTRLLDATERSGAESKFVARHPERARPRDAPFGRYLMSNRGLSEDEAGEVLYLLLRSASLESVGDSVEANKLLDAVERMVPGLASVENARTSGPLARRDRGNAHRHLARAVNGYESDPELAEADPGGYSAACANLAQLLCSPHWRQPETALSLAEKAISLFPENARTQLSYGMALMSAGRLRDAARSYAIAETLDPSNARIATMRRCCDLLQATKSPEESDYPARSEDARPLSAENEHFARELMEAYAAAMLADEHEN